MGNKQGKSSQKKEKHLLHYNKLDENKLWVFYPRSEKYECYPVFREEKPFFFGNLETVSIASKNRIYIIGGSYFKEQPEYRPDANDQSLVRAKKEVVLGNEIGVEGEEADLPELSETLYMRAERAAENMIPTDLVGYIDIKCIKKDKDADKLEFVQASIEPMPKPRTSHSMAFIYPFIYVIGGIVDNLPTKQNLKYDIEDNVWSDVAPIGFSSNLSSPAIVAYSKYILVFDCYSETQNIHRYQVDFDVWENIAFNTPEFKIPRSLNATAFRYDSNSILLVNGICQSRDESCHYYVYDIEKEMFIADRSDRKLEISVKDRQGERDYSSSGKVFSQLNADGKVKVFHSSSFYWDVLQMYLVRISKSKSVGFAGCLSKR